MELERAWEEVVVNAGFVRKYSSSLGESMGLWQPQSPSNTSSIQFFLKERFAIKVKQRNYCGL